MEKRKVLFICVHNSGRSQMAEAFLNHLAGDRFEAESAGFEPTGLNPLVVEAMAEKGLDLSGKTAKSVFELFRQGRMYNHVITVCDGGRAAKCPVFPGITAREHMPFEDPAEASGDREQKLSKIRGIRDQIERAVTRWIEDRPSWKG